jgi:adenosyl cobinamide kinase/adenosyl cobinamide phosphate guanylyltransferase
MTPRTWRRALVLGGTRSGKSEFAEALLAGEAAVRYVATGWRDEADPEWERRIEAHQRRRLAHWTTVEVGADPWRLPAELARADPAQAVFVDELGTWVAAVMGVTGEDQDLPVDRMATELGAAVRACAATVVLVRPGGGARAGGPDAGPGALR